MFYGLYTSNIRDHEADLLVTSMDAKFGFDDNADFRQKDVFKLRDTTQEDPQEVEAAEVSSLICHSVQKPRTYRCVVWPEFHQTRR